MSWPRHTCPFGLPDELECTENIVLTAVGHVLRETGTDLIEAPLPAQIAALLCQLDGGAKPAPRQRPRARVHGERGIRVRPAQNMPSASLASSDMRSLSHGGSKVSFTDTCPTPATEAHRILDPGRHLARDRATGRVSVISTATLRASSTSIL